MVWTVTSSVPCLQTCAMRALWVQLLSAQQQTCHLQHHVVNKVSGEGGTVPHTLGFLSRAKPGQPQSFGPGIQGSVTVMVTRGAVRAAGSSLRGRRGRRPARGALGAAPPPLDVLRSLRIHRGFSGGGVRPVFPNETNLHRTRAESDSCRVSTSPGDS